MSVEDRVEPRQESEDVSEPGPGARSSGDRVEIATLILVGIVGMIALAVGVRTRWYDYDEVLRAHSGWLAAQGLRPYSDFFECHPPYFALLIPFVRLFPDPTSLLQALRIFGVAGNILFLAGLARLGPTSEGGRRWAWLGVGFIACHPDVLDDLVEFRADGWGYALATWGFVRFRLMPPGFRRHFELGLWTSIASAVFCPKLAFLPPLVILFEMAGAWRSPRTALRIGAAYASGTAMAAFLVALSLALQGIRFGDVYALLIRYHSIFNANSSYRHGLIASIVARPLLAVTTIVGLVAWAGSRISRRKRPVPIELGLATWLVLQAALVSYPHKQYFAPWFLFSSVFLAYLATSSADRPARVHKALFIVAGFFAIAISARQASNWYRIDEARRDEDIIRWMNRVARPEDRVVAAPPHHPIDRHDTFFLWFNTHDPGGFDSEEILRRIPLFEGKVADSRYREELETHPPALIAVIGPWRKDPYTKGQIAALSEFVARHGYQPVRRGKVTFAVRPDRLDAAR